MPRYIASKRQSETGPASETLPDEDLIAGAAEQEEEWLLRPPTMLNVAREHHHPERREGQVHVGKIPGSQRMKRGMHDTPCVDTPISPRTSNGKPLSSAPEQRVRHVHWWDETAAAERAHHHNHGTIVQRDDTAQLTAHAHEIDQRDEQSIFSCCLEVLRALAVTVRTSIGC